MHNAKVICDTRKADGTLVERPYQGPSHSPPLDSGRILESYRAVHQGVYTAGIINDHDANISIDAK